MLKTANSTSTSAILRRRRPVTIVWMIPDEEPEIPDSDIALAAMISVQNFTENASSVEMRYDYYRDAFSQ